MMRVGRFSIEEDADMSDRDLKLNTLRTVKQSPDLVLEEHGHCEVPAGCGGVVLRWRKRSLRPIEVWIHTLASKSVYLDGQALETGRPLIPPGEHVLAMRFQGIDPEAPVLMAACIDGEKPSKMVSPDAGAFRILSLPEGSWKYATSEPVDPSWMRPGFDDSGWRPMIARDFPPPDEKDWSSRGRIQHIQKLGGQGLGIEGPAVVLLVRKTFVVEA